MIKFLVAFVFVFVFAVAVAMPASGQSPNWQQITACGDMKGRAFYFAGGAVPKNKSGWQDDAIAGGTTSLLTDGKDVDIVYKDATGRQRSAKFHDGATILAFSVGTILNVLIVHKGGVLLEQYTFQIDKQGRGIVILSQQRAGIVSKVSTMQAKCKRD